MAAILCIRLAIPKSTWPLNRLPPYLISIRRSELGIRWTPRYVSLNPRDLTGAQLILVEPLSSSHRYPVVRSLSRVDDVMLWRELVCTHVHMPKGIDCPISRLSTDSMTCPLPTLYLDLLFCCLELLMAFTYLPLVQIRDDACKYLATCLYAKINWAFCLSYCLKPGDTLTGSQTRVGM